MDKGDIEEMIKKLEREANVEDMASAWSLSVVLELPRLETLFFTCLYDVLSVARYKWLLPLKTWFQTKWTEKHRVVEVNAFKLGDDVDEIEKTVTEKIIMEVEGGNESGDRDEAVIRTRTEKGPSHETWP
jgi:trehalose-6-phosphate synthase